MSQGSSIVALLDRLLLTMFVIITSFVLFFVVTVLDQERSVWVESQSRNDEQSIESFFHGKFMVLRQEAQLFLENNPIILSGNLSSTKQLLQITARETQFDQIIVSRPEKRATTIWASSREALFVEIEKMYHGIEGILTPLPEDIGFYHINGRFFFHLTLHVKSEPREKFTTISFIQELLPKETRKMAKQMHGEVYLSVDSPGHVVTKISNAGGLYVTTKHSKYHDDSYMSELGLNDNLTFNQGLTISLYRDMPRKYPFPEIVVIGSCLVFISIAFWGFRQFLYYKAIYPTRTLISEINNSSDEDEFSRRTQDNMHKLPSEVVQIYRKFGTLQERYRQNREFNEFLLNAAGDMVFVLSGEGKILYVNPVAQRWLNLDEVQILGRRLSFFFVNTHCDSLPVSSWASYVLTSTENLYLKTAIRTQTERESVEQAVVMGNRVEARFSKENSEVLIMLRESR